MFKSIITALNGFLSLIGLRAQAERDASLKRDGARDTKEVINDERDKIREDAKKYRNDHRNDSDDDIIDSL